VAERTTRSSAVRDAAHCKRVLDCISHYPPSSADRFRGGLPGDRRVGSRSRCSPAHEAALHAIDFRAPDQPIRVELGALGSRAVIEVWDGGAVVDPALLSSAVDCRVSGSGVGLYIAREIALAHGGEIDLRSDGAVETRFRVVRCRPSRPERVGRRGCESSPSIAWPVNRQHRCHHRANHVLGDAPEQSARNPPTPMRSDDD
jgi:hypothetical protein